MESEREMDKEGERTAIRQGEASWFYGKCILVVEAGGAQCIVLTGPWLQSSSCT